MNECPSAFFLLQLIGSIVQFGVFDGGEDAIGISSGVLLSNGFVSSANFPASTLASTDLFAPGDIDLPSLNNDAAVFLIEFEVTEPLRISLSYVYASGR